MTKFQTEVQPNSWLVTLIEECIRKKPEIQWDQGFEKTSVPKGKWIARRILALCPWIYNVCIFPLTLYVQTVQIPSFFPHYFIGDIRGSKLECRMQN